MTWIKLQILSNSRFYLKYLLVFQDQKLIQPQKNKIQIINTGNNYQSEPKQDRTHNLPA